MSEQYIWSKETPYSELEYEDAMEWMSPFLFSKRTAHIETPLLKKIGKNKYHHWFNVIIFPQQSYSRPFTIGKIFSEDRGDEIVTIQKKIFIHPYKGDVDALLELSAAPYEMDAESRGHIVLLNGTLKAGIFPENGGKSKQIVTAEEYYDTLDNYLEVKGIGKSLMTVISNSNLPDEVKKRFSSLTA